MGEYHYSRGRADEWERELLKMKAGGVTVVSTYVFWIHHEETEGHFDWSGQRDLGQFVRLCAKHGLYVWLRIGPWAHGEARNGGFPDWLVQSGLALRENNPAYLEKVRRFYGAIAAQVKGQFWGEGGPIIGVQIENEYHPATGGIEHMRTLRELAIALGMKAPYYSATGWDRANVPLDGYLPVFGGYTEQFWSASLQPLPPNQNFFYTAIRAEDNVMGDLSPKNAAQNARYDAFPFLTAEMGGGMAIAYHRRPIMHADDSTAAAQVKLGSGVTGLGFYMYHGGTNPDGRTSLQETLSAWHGYNDMEAKSYDFQAPLGEFGQINATYRTLKTLGLFLRDFGRDLAPMVAHFPQARPTGRDDATTPRAAVRSDGHRAFVFINDYERNTTLPPLADFQLQLKLADETLTVPRRPVTIPSGAYPIWPINAVIGGVKLRYATAQPLARLDEPATWVFFAWDGLPANFAFETQPGDRIEAPSAALRREGSIVYVENVQSGKEAAITVRRPGTNPVQIVILTYAQALNFWKAPFDGRERLWIAKAALTFARAGVQSVADRTNDLTLAVYPAIERSLLGYKPSWTSGVFQTLEPTRVGNQRPVTAEVFAANGLAHQTAPAQPAPPPHHGPDTRPVAIQPADEDYAQAATWTLHFPPDIIATATSTILSIRYEGDVARIYTGDRLDNDNFYKGTPWELGLWRYTPEQLKAGLTLKILALRQDAPVFLETAAVPPFGPDHQALRLLGISWRRLYDAELAPGPSRRLTCPAAGRTDRPSPARAW